jgi:hypothetical protein
MSVRFSGTKQHLLRTTGLPTSASSFTICGFAKMQVANTNNFAVIAYLANAGAADSHQAFVDSGTGTLLKGSNDWGTSYTASVATLTAGGASGTNWFFFALVGSASGAGGLKVYHKPVGSGTLASQVTANSNWSTPAELRFGDNSLADGSFGLDAFFFDGNLAHLKVYSAALTDAELLAESSKASPQRSAGLISYHSLVGASLGAVLAPTTGTGTFTTPTNLPAISSDDPVLSPTIGVSWVEMDVPFAAASIAADGVVSRAAIGQPAVSIVGAASTVRVSWVEMEIPPPAAATAPSSVASRAAVGTPEAQSNTQPTGVLPRRAVGTPQVGTGPIVFASGVASAAAVGTPDGTSFGQVNGTGSITIEQAQTVNALGVQTRRAVGTPLATYVGSATLTGVASRRAVGNPIISIGDQVNLESYGVLSRAAVGLPEVLGITPTQTISLTAGPSRRAVGNPAIAQIGGSVESYGGGADADDDEVGPHKVPKHMRGAPAAGSVPAAVKKASKRKTPVEARTITADDANAPVPVKGGVLVTPDMLEKIKSDAMAAAKLQFELRNRRDSKLVEAARDIGQQRAQARLERLADLAIEAAEEAEYEPAEREQTKTIEIEDPVTGKPIRATITSKVPA